jgi:hypothetical protein
MRNLFKRLVNRLALKWRGHKWCSNRLLNAHLDWVVLKSHTKVELALYRIGRWRVDRAVILYTRPEIELVTMRASEMIPF